MNILYDFNMDLVSETNLLALFNNFLLLVTFNYSSDLYSPYSCTLLDQAGDTY